MKKLVILAFAAFGLFATTNSNKKDIPFPMCQPCDMAR
jgi:hypothetical protein